MVTVLEVDDVGINCYTFGGKNFAGGVYETAKNFLDTSDFADRGTASLPFGIRGDAVLGRFDDL